ncbi:PREDICTED: glucan endo-1,3-beta-glucosidase 10 [Tarenaya hassleriana]|uniref:glucan endo-1,3-beta-glucosidase 10 n=1 Tax=Tarenaya hassleriana TaxID=28532 RepID=UPI00053C890A|nr:PREDICTED: glucan endo-1,3-beta-glucosidase 10 [Tarenaya hassleriana]
MASPSTPALLSLALSLSLPLIVASIGINYGQVADNLPPPQKVIPLVKSIGATKVKLYDADPQVLRAFAGSGVEFTVGLGNEYLTQMKDPGKALDWVKQNVQAYLPSTKIVAITVGNEVLTSNQTSLVDALFPAMQNIHSALVDCGLNKQIFVTTAHSLAVLDVSYPPSATAFRHDLLPCLTPILDFHTKTGSPLLINAYPYFAYEENPKHVALDFVLFQQNQGFTDPGTNFHYDNMLFAQVDAVYHALDGVNYKKVPIVVSETGWPSNGDEEEVGATCDNARKYNGNLIKMMMSKKMRTPMRPDCDLTVYVFALFNENKKPGPTSERNYGLFQPDGTPVYSLGIKVGSVSGGSGGNSSVSGGGGGGGGGGGSGGPGGVYTPGISENPSPDYMSISSAADKSRFLECVMLLLLGFIKLLL